MNRMSDVFRPVGELAEAEDAVVVERRDSRWAGPVCDAVDRVVDDGDTVYLMEDGRRVARITPYDSVG